jgi:predicted DNA-binding transcriptional regulator AlpA
MEIEQLICNICSKPSRNEGACVTCRFNLRTNLTELPALQVKAGEYLEPGRSSSGSPTTERSIGINVSALDFSMATELLAIFHGWEQIIRADRRLTPPALLLKEPTIEKEVKATCDFHLAHLDWIVKQDWVKDFSGEVKELHSKGLAAAKEFREQPRRIPCPSDDCFKFVVIDAQNLDKGVTCHGCKNSWSVIRLIALAMSNPNRRFYLDIEAIALWLGITQRAVYKIIKANKIPQKQKLFDLSAIIEARTKNQLT